MVRKINKVFSQLWVLVLGMVLMVGVACTNGGVFGEVGMSFSESGPSPKPSMAFDLSNVDSLPSRWMPSAYFDRGMGTDGARFEVVSLTQLVAGKKGEFDAVLLNCYDDYQGILSIEDIKKYDLQLATRMELPEGFKKHDWLNPMLIIVPGGDTPIPFQERFMTVNIRELRGVRLRDYYAPIDRIGGSSMGSQRFKDNCLFCHSVKGVGGNKGARLLPMYDYSNSEERLRFSRDFSGFHNPSSSQNLEQFVDESAVQSIYDFLKQVAAAP